MDCIVENGKCDKVGAIYRITCNKCQSEVDENQVSHNYVGLTRTTLHNRMSQHLKAQRQKLSCSAMHRHDCDVHSGEVQAYSAKIIAQEKRIVRLHCTEALHIERQERPMSINVKMEGGRTSSGVVRLTAIREHN